MIDHILIIYRKRERERERDACEVLQKLRTIHIQHHGPKVSVSSVVHRRVLENV